MYKIDQPLLADGWMEQLWHERQAAQAEEVERLRSRIAELEAENATLRAMIDGALTAAEAMVATLAGAR